MDSQTDGNPIAINGKAAPGFEPVVDAFRENFSARGELGAAVTVVVNGEVVVDLWGGWTGPGGGRQWDEGSLTNVWSATKGLVAICALQLVESGDLDLDAPVAQYWPEFAAAGKADIPVRWLLSHRSGVVGVSPERPVSVEDLLDWDTMVKLLADQEPFFEPGTASGYQAVSYGYLVGEVIRRAVGETVGRLLLGNVAKPLSADVHLGLDPSDLERCTTLVEPSEVPGPTPTEAPPRAVAAALGNPVPLGRYANERRWRLAELPALNGHATARGLATVYGALVDGSERLLQRRTVDLGRTSQGLCTDVVAGVTNEFGLGFTLGSVQRSFGPNPAAFGHDGFGGSTGFADPESGVGFGYVMNRMGPHLRDDPRKMALVAATYASLGKM